ncbi:hypothetical protein CAEBREN_15899 [Caenorhabditis brenneri]|uniref:Uncharacterized protein n=1 Tax=Caenorhabditis brenneri TaxID=135651 RepID=G0NJQ8_CAEBE|nr:hypothetical protein CAEBREN_15899 [Caenorhabditis brenneri]
MDFSGIGVSQTWGSVINGVTQKKNNWDSKSRIDVGQIMEKIQRDNYIVHFYLRQQLIYKLQRRQRSIENSEKVSNDIMNWKKESDLHMKSLESGMEELRKRKEEIRQNLTEMTFLASQLRQKLSKVQDIKQENQLFDGEEGNQCTLKRRKLILFQSKCRLHEKLESAIATKNHPN